MLYPPLIALRERLRATQMKSIFLIVCDGDHYSAYCYHYDRMLIEFGDTLGNDPLDEVLDIFRWVLNGLDYPVPTSIVGGDISDQNLAPGTRCGIAAFNFNERQVDLTADQWTGQASPVYQNLVLRDLLIYHFISKMSTEVCPLCVFIVLES